MKLGRYDTVAEIGRGGMGVVLKARSPEGTDVAIKLLSRTDGARTARFERERRLLETFGEADGFVPVLDWGESSHGPIIVMPLLGGGTLRTKLAHGPLAFDDAIELGKTLARAIARAHERGIIHRDLKPDNVIFSTAGRPFVADLGLAKYFKTDDPSSKSVSLSRTGETLGTAGYMAPEQLTDAKSVGPEADVFALGTVLYECLTGDAVFVGETTIEVLIKVERGIHEPLRLRRPDLPRWVDAVIERAIASEPGDRFRDAGELARALEAGPPAPKRGAPLALLGVSVLALGGAVLVATLTRGKPAAVPVAPVPVAPKPPVKPATPAEPLRPSVSDPFAKTARTRLAAVWGTYAGKHGAMIGRVLFSPDGKLGGSCSLDGTVRLWDLKDGHELRAFRGHKAEVDTFDFTPDSTRVVSVSRDNALRVFSVATGETLKTFPDVAPGGGGLSVSPDGKHALVAYRGEEIHLVDLESGATVRTLAASTGGIEGVALSPDGTRVLSSHGDKLIRLYDLATGELIRTLDGPPLDGQTAIFSPDGTRALSGSKTGTACLWDLTTGKPLATLTGHRGWVTGLAFSRDGKEILTGSFDNTMKRWSVEAALHGGDPLLQTYEFPEWVNTVAISPDGRQALAGGNDQCATLVELATGQVVFPASGHRGRVAALDVSADGKRAVTGGVDRVARIWDVASGSEIKKLAPTKTWIAKVAISPDGTRILTGGGQENVEGGTAELILSDAVAGTTVAAFVGSSGGVRSLALSGDGTHALSASLSRKPETNAVEWVFDPEVASRALAHGRSMVVVATYGLDGSPLMGDASGALSLELASGARSLAGAPSPILAIDAHGTRAITGKQDGTIELWDLDPLKVSAVWKSGGLPVSCVALSSDGAFAVSSSDDGKLQLWDLGQGDATPIDTIGIDAADDRAEAIAFVPGGHSFLVATLRGVVLRFEVVPK